MVNHGIKMVLQQTRPDMNDRTYFAVLDWVSHCCNLPLRVGLASLMLRDISSSACNSALNADTLDFNRKNPSPASANISSIC